MNILIPKEKVVKEQELVIEHAVNIIYGYNNSGKTTILNSINNVLNDKIMENFIRKRECDLVILIPTNRVVVSDVKTEDTLLGDLEDFVNYQRDSYKNYSLHLKQIRDYLLKYEIVVNFIYKIVKKIFDIKVDNIKDKYSDGIENIINIYLNIIWSMTWNIDIGKMDEDSFLQMLSDKKIYVLIDEIEMFLHVNIQAKLINSLKEDFKNCRFILTTHSPLILTRYRETAVFNIENGFLNYIDDELYYEDLDKIYETLFFVEELPQQIREDINYLGDVILHKEDYDKNKVGKIKERLYNEYPNLGRRYNRIIVKAQGVGES